MTGPSIDIVTAVIRDATGRMLVVRKRGTAIFMKPGGIIVLRWRQHSGTVFHLVLVELRHVHAVPRATK